MAPAPLSTYKPSYMHCVGTEPLFALTLGQLVQKAAEKWGEKEAFFSAYEEKRYSFKEAQEEVIYIFVQEYRLFYLIHIVSQAYLVICLVSQKVE